MGTLDECLRSKTVDRTTVVGSVQFTVGRTNEDCTITSVVEPGWKSVTTGQIQSKYTDTVLGRLESFEIQVKPALWSSRLECLVGKATEVATKRDKVFRDLSIEWDILERDEGEAQ